MKGLSKNLTPRESFLLALLNKVTQEYKALRETIRRSKPYKIIEITRLSKVPGETEFLVQIVNKSHVMKLTAAQMVNQGYDLNSFDDFHTKLIHKALQGKVLEFLGMNEDNLNKRVLSKTFDKRSGQYLFTLSDEKGVQFIRTAEEISKNKMLLSSMSFQEVFDIGYTQGSASVIKEKLELVLAKKQNNLNQLSCNINI